MLLITISVENLTRYDDIVWEIALCTFNLVIIKAEHILKNNKLWKTFVYISLLYVQDENQDMLMQYKRL